MESATETKTDTITVTPNKLSCNSKIFDQLNDYAAKNASIRPDVVEANVLYNNGKFYYSSGESVGALVSYSCATVLLNTILRKLPPTELKLILNVNTIMNSLLQVVQSLQQKVGSSKSSDKDDNEKDWAKICTKIKPLVFKKGGSDCLFYNDVAGLQKEKKIIDSSLVYPLIYPNLYPKTSKGILIYGPPGTGKTYLVKAAVNELQKKDDSVGVLFFAPSPGDLKGKYVGETEKRIEEAFRCASDAACTYQADCPGKKKYISIIFMDEMDAIAPDRDKDTTGLAVNSVNTLLQMMDGIKSFPNVAVVAATNYPWNLDAAILRRFDTQLLINIPNQYDLKELFNIEMNKFIDLEADKSNFSYCDSKGKKKDDSTDLSCELECESKPIVEKYRNYPYSEYQIDYFLNNKVGGLIDGIIFQLEKDKFSNSDLNRLIKAAATNAGELAVNESLFYSPKLLGDFEHDKYISSLTGLRISQEITTGTAKGKKVVNLVKIAQLSIDILDAFVNNKLPANVIQLNPPDFVRIEYDGYYYYNSKCLLYKNAESIVQHYSIKDIYIKGHPAIAGFDFNTWKTNVKGGDNYFANILGASIEDLQKPDASITKGNIDMIIAFDFTFKQNKNYSNKQTLLPVYRDLINYVFQPIYNKFGEIKKNIEQSEKIGKNIRGPTGEIDTEISQQYAQGIKEPPAPPVARGGAKFDFTDDDIQQIKDSEFLKEEKKGIVTLSESVKKIIHEDGFYDDWNTTLNNKFTSINDHNLDFYNFLLLNKVLNKFTSEFVPLKDNDASDSDETHKNIDDLLDRAINDYTGVLTEERKIKEKILVNVCGNRDIKSPDYNKSIDDVIKMAKSPQSKCDKVTLNAKIAEYDALKIKKNEIYEQYIKLQTIKDEMIRSNDVDANKVNKNSIDLYLSMINSDGKITEAISKIDDMGFKSYTLINGETITMYYYKVNKDDNYGIFRITIKQYKDFIKNFYIYNNILLCSSEFDSKLIDIPEDLFEILFKDVFSDIKITTTDVEELKQIWTPNSLDVRIMQLYINDTIRIYNLNLELFNDSNIKKNIEVIKISTENQINGYLYGYLLALFNEKLDISKISDLCIQVINDNYNLTNKNKATFLGKEHVDQVDTDSSIVDQNTLAKLYPSPTKIASEETKKIIEEKNAALTKEKKDSSDAEEDRLKNLENAQEIGIEIGTKAAEEEAKKELNHKISLLGNIWNALQEYMNPSNDDDDDVEIPKISGGKPKTLKNRRQHSHLSSSFRKNKKHSESKARSFKSKKIIHKKQTYTLKNRPKYIGGAKMSEDLEKFLEWCVKNKQKDDNPGDFGPIAGKTIFVKTVFKYEELIKQRKHGVISDIWNMGGTGDRTWGEWWNGDKKKTPKQRANEVLQEIKSKNQLLPLIFNNIQAIGTLTKSDNKITDDSLLFKTPTDLKLKWQEIAVQTDGFWIDNFGKLASTLLGIRSKPGKGFLNNVTGTIATIISSGLVGLAGASAPIVGLLVGVLVITIAGTANWLTQNPDINKPEDVILYMVSQALFTILTEVRYIECQSFNDPGGANGAILLEIAERAKQINEVWTNSYKGTKNPLEGIKITGTDKTQIEKLIVDVALYTADAKTVISKEIKNKLVNLNIPMQSFYYAMNIVKSTYNKETGPLLTQYYENRDLFMENYKKREQKQSK
jgi:SpoVK/Ycf46/Vps4 family AAA+-type ATPase